MTLEEAVKYIKDHRERIMWLESEIEKEKKNPDYIKASGRLRVAACNKQNGFEEAPCRANNYKLPEIYERME